ncbi:chromatin remodeling complex subunit, partial [Macrolepiota fuliginosa MF-IS2]
MNNELVGYHTMDDDSKIFTIPPLSLPSLAPPPLSYEGNSNDIIIDNGSTTFRWGFSQQQPYTAPNVVAKYKERRNNKPLLLFGEAVDCETGARGQARTPWEGDVLLNFDALENTLDYAFLQLGINIPSIDHRIIMTERLATPLHSRALTSELLFELYSVPEVTYCVDGIMSFYKNNGSTKPFTADGLVLSFNTASTSIIPILSGRGILSYAKRIPWGASQASDYLLKLIQLKYSSFPTRVTPTQTNWMLRNVCSFVPDYIAHLRSINSPEALRASECIIQFPFVIPVQEEKTEEELARISEKRKEQGKKLQEMAAKNRAEKLLQKENDLQYLTALKEGKGSDSKREWTNKLQSEGFDSDAALEQAIKKLEAHVGKARKKEQGIIEPDEPAEEPSFPLVDVPDADLDEENLKEKRRQKLMKAGYEARVRARKEKEREREEKEREEKKEEEEREADPKAWSKRLRSEQEALMTRIKGRTRRKAALSDRKSAAAQARMKSIANLASDDRVPKKKRKGGGEDMFGADDDDWAIYRKINTTNVSSDEEEDLGQLQVIEQKLLQYDPTFTILQTHASISSQRSALLTAFKPGYEDGDTRGNTRIHLSTERWRACETWFSPSMAGVDSAGLGEVIQNVLARFNDAEKGRLVNNIFLTGGPSQFPGLKDRLHAALRPILPPEMPITVQQAQNPMMDAWNGMNQLSEAGEHNGYTRQDYEEHGGERIRKWWGGNWN